MICFVDVDYLQIMRRYVFRGFAERENSNLMQMAEKTSKLYLKMLYFPQRTPQFPISYLASLVPHIDIC